MDAEMHAENGANCSSSRRHNKFACFVIFDAEATGLPGLLKKTRFTELSFFAVQTAELVSHCTPRTINKLKICINPECAIDPDVCTKTGSVTFHKFQLL
jgi:hypothetical protein